MTIVRILKALATFIPGVYRLRQENPRGTVSPRYCYSVWLRHLVMARRAGLPTSPRVVAELGPGDSLGLGLAAILSGADRYFAFDVVQYAHSAGNAAVLEGLIELFRARSPIPGDDEYPQVLPKLASYAFPHDILTEPRLAAALAEDRVAALRAAVASENPPGIGGIEIRYFVPWYDAGLLAPGSVDLICSQAVLEYVPDLPQTYGRFKQWLAPGGGVSLVIDYRSHGTSAAWDGHRSYSDLAWRLMRGKQPYTLNRESHSTHVRLLGEAGLEVVGQVPMRREPVTPRAKLAKRFRALSDDDLSCACALVQAMKRSADGRRS
jgi:hypothetical protein